MKAFRCGDVVPGCTATFTGTESDILAQVADHARVDHHMHQVPTEVVAAVQAAMVPA
ncbi:DUF1059 domain-containing protein [Solicola sp. PLA-1-18]|uniref:DUF1059 domain-containing protein n=1 Tax=Solicola sp. PLA-1-18 TaxID=3380532 RepID=UPI003B78AE1E